MHYIINGDNSWLTGEYNNGCLKLGAGTYSSRVETTSDGYCRKIIVSLDRIDDIDKIIQYLQEQRDAWSKYLEETDTRYKAEKIFCEYIAEHRIKENLTKDEVIDLLAKVFGENAT